MGSRYVSARPHVRDHVRVYNNICMTLQTYIYHAVCNLSLSRGYPLPYVVGEWSCTLFNHGISRNVMAAHVQVGIVAGTKHFSVRYTSLLLPLVRC